MSRINDLLRQLRSQDPALTADLEREVIALQDRRAFGLNFERHVPEAIDLPGRKVRKGDKVRVLPPRGHTATAANGVLWRVASVDRISDAPTASLEAMSRGSAEADPETRPAALDDLVVVAEFRDPIYPGLVSTGAVERGGDKPFHTVINAENFHALEMLLFTHRGNVDAIYIDPPYNTGAKDWKYNNDYVESDDLYRHSKWLAMMERRLLLAKELLDPDNSVLIVTIDEKEYGRLGLLLEQIFPESNIQMVTSVVNRKGVIRANELTRTNEFIYFVTLGGFRYTAESNSEADKVRWASLRRMDIESRRGTPKGGQAQFFPIYVGEASGRIEDIGDPIPPHVSRDTVQKRPGCITLWPLRPDGTEMNWGLTRETVKGRLDDGFVKVVPGRTGKSPTLYYLTRGQVADVKAGRLQVTGRDSDGSVIVAFQEGKSSLPTTQWDRDSHNAQSHGTGILTALIPGRKFPFPKSLYAVEDCLRLAVGGKPSAVVLDFFCGSGTTAHAVMRLNRQDGGSRRSICVTNNEVGANEHDDLWKKGLRPGDAEWDQRGICEYITKPRIEAAITGKTPEAAPIKGDYKFTDEFPMAEGFAENVEFFALTYEAPLRVASNRDFAKIAPLLWMRAGSRGRRIGDISSGWDVADAYGVLADLDHTGDFIKAVAASAEVEIAYVITDEPRLFEAVCRELPDHVTPVRLYEAYLRNFEIESGRGVL